MIHQDSNKFSNPTLMGWLFAEEADNEVFVVFCMEHYKLVLSIGDAQASQLQGGAHRPLGCPWKDELNPATATC